MVAVITINYNLHEDTIACVDSILKSDFHDLIVFLVDNGSSVEDYQELKKAFQDVSRVKLLRIDKNRGYVGGVNFGLSYAALAHPSHYMIMNNDTILDPAALSELVKTSDKFENKAIVSGKVYHFDKPDTLQQTGLIFTDHRYLRGYYPGKNELDQGQYDKIAERDSLDDVFWLLPYKLVEELGYYCEYYFLYAEQGDYAQHARKAGYKLIYEPRAKIWHKGSMTTGGGNRRAIPICYWRGKSGFIFQYRNLKLKYFISVNIYSLVKDFLRLFKFHGNERKCVIARLRGKFAGIYWLITKKKETGYNPYLK